ncbi:MAG: hypothetical protein AAF632_18705 [Bacteroidota bacterium]
MKVLEGWDLATMVDSTLDAILNGSLGLVSAILLIRVLLEINKGLFANNYRYHIPSFLSILVTLVGILTYKEFTALIGDAFFDVATALRGAGETEFNSTRLWEAIKDHYGEPGDNASVYDIATNWLNDTISGPLGPVSFGLDMLQNWFGLATMLSWQATGLLLRWGMVIFKNIVYCLMIFSGPIPLILSLFPAFSGFAIHWIKNFIVVCYWNVTIALLDVIMNALNYQMLRDFAFNGDEEMSIGLLTMMTAIMYLFVPYLTSLAIGQTVVAMAGSKMVMTPVAVAATVARYVGTGGAGAATQAAKAKPAAAASQKASSSSFSSAKAPQINDGVRSVYTATPTTRRAPVIDSAPSTPASHRIDHVSRGSQHHHYGASAPQSSSGHVYMQSSNQNSPPRETKLPPKKPQFLLQQKND